MKKLIVIDKFQMPNNCWYCPICHESMYGDLYCGINDTINIEEKCYRDKRHEECPLKEVIL